MHKQRIAILILSVVGGIGSMGPWLTFLNQTLSGSARPDGWAAAGLFGIILVTVLFGGLKTSFGLVKVITHAVLSACAACLGVYSIYQITDKLNLSSDAVSMEWGLPVLVVSAVAIPVVGYLMMEKTSSTKVNPPGSSES